jgi:phosphate transport system substrate-binding protein
MSPHRADIRALAVEGVLPTSDTIGSCRYPFVTEVYVVVLGDLSSKLPAHRLRDWLLGPTGQAVVAESGYVPIVPN